MLSRFTFTLIAIPIVLASVAASWALHNRTEQQIGQQQLRARIDHEARQIDGKAKTAIQRNEALPANRVLDGWYRD